MSTIYQIAVVTLFVALFVAFIILFLEKTELRSIMRDMCDKKHLRLLADMLDCDFCFSFWLSTLISLCIAVLLQDCAFLIIPILSTPITRILL